MALAGVGDIQASYFGVVELTRQLDQEKLAYLTVRVESLRDENEILKAKVIKSEKDTHEFVAYFQREMEAKDSIISSLNDEITKRETDFRVQVKHIREKTELELSELKESARTVEKQLSAQIKLLEGDLATLEQYRDLKEAHDRRTEELKVKITRMEEDHTLALTSMERKFLTEKVQQRNEMEQMAEEIQRQANIEAQNSLSGETKRIVAENKSMGEELRFQLQMTAALQADKKSLEEELKDLRLETGILRDKDAEYARQAHNKLKESARLTDEVLNLQKALQDAVVRGREDQERVRKNVSRELEDQTLDAQGLRQLLVLKNRELRHIRKLSGYILEQRSELERFFLEALQEVKTRVLEERKMRHRQAVAEYNMRIRDANRIKTKFPKIRNLALLDPGPASALPTNPDTKVDLKDLTWDDKERVLRLLFAKINCVSGKVQNLPEHPLEQEGEEADHAGLSPAPGKGYADPTFVTEQQLRQQHSQTLLQQGGGGGGGGGSSSALSWIGGCA